MSLPPLTEETAKRHARMEEIRAMLATDISDLPGFMQAVAEDMQSLTYATGAVIELVEGSDMVYEAATGSVADYKGFRIKAATSLSGLCVRTGLITYSKDTANDPRVDADACRKVNAASMIVVPLYRHEKIVGVLKTLSNKPYAFGAYEIQTLEMLAGLLGEALGKHLETH